MSGERVFRESLLGVARRLRNATYPDLWDAMSREERLTARFVTAPSCRPTPGTGLLLSAWRSTGTVYPSMNL